MNWSFSVSSCNKSLLQKGIMSEFSTHIIGQNAWTSLNIHYQRSGKFECESAHNKRRAKIGSVALIKLAFLVSRSINLPTHARHFEEECYIYLKAKTNKIEV